MVTTALWPSAWCGSMQSASYDNQAMRGSRNLQDSRQPASMTDPIALPPSPGYTHVMHTQEPTVHH